MGFFSGHFRRSALLLLTAAILFLGNASAADPAIAHPGGALLFPSVQQLQGSVSEQGLLQDHRGVEISPGAKSIRVPDRTTVHVISDASVSYPDAAGVTIVVPVVRIKVMSSGLTDGATGLPIGFQSSTGFMLKERLP